MKKKLSAKHLKDELWETLIMVKSGELTPDHGMSIASQAREILRTIKIQLQIHPQVKQNLPMDIVEFTKTP